MQRSIFLTARARFSGGLPVFLLALCLSASTHPTLASEPTVDTAALTAQIQSKKDSIKKTEEEIRHIRSAISDMGYPNPFGGAAEVQRLQTEFNGLQSDLRMAQLRLTSLRADLTGLQGDLSVATRPVLDLSSLSCDDPGLRASRDAFRDQHGLPPLDRHCNHDAYLVHDECILGDTPEVRQAACEIRRADCLVIQAAIDEHYSATLEWYKSTRTAYSTPPSKMSLPRPCRLALNTYATTASSPTVPVPVAPTFVPEPIPSITFPTPGPSATAAYACQHCRERARHACQQLNVDWVKNSDDMLRIYRHECNDDCSNICP